MFYFILASLLVFPYGFYCFLKFKMKLSLFYQIKIFSKLLFLSTLFIIYCLIQYFGFKINLYIFYEMKYRFNEIGIYERYRDITSILISCLFILIGLVGVFIRFNNINNINSEIETKIKRKSNSLAFNLICLLIHITSFFYIVFDGFLE